MLRCWRRVRDSNPRILSESLVFKTSSLNRSDNSPGLFKKSPSIKDELLAE